jgi:hypothetical protein
MSASLTSRPCTTLVFVMAQSIGQPAQTSPAKKKLLLHLLFTKNKTMMFIIELG